MKSTYVFQNLAQDFFNYWMPCWAQRLEGLGQVTQWLHVIEPHYQIQIIQWLNKCSKLNNFDILVVKLCAGKPCEMGSIFSIFDLI